MNARNLKDMDDLTKLAIKYGTDKWGKHHYTPIYYNLFRNKRNDIRGVLEIGPAEGAGLFMFRDFFPNANIYGAEVDKKRLDKLQNLERVKVFAFDQSNFDSAELEELFMHFQNLDIVIDDGSHNPTDQMLSCFGIMPFLNKEATYIIEDVVDVKVAEYLSRKYCVEVIECGKRYDDRLIVVKHK